MRICFTRLAASELTLPPTELFLPTDAKLDDTTSLVVRQRDGIIVIDTDFAFLACSIEELSLPIPMYWRQIRKHLFREESIIELILDVARGQGMFRDQDIPYTVESFYNVVREEAFSAPTNPKLHSHRRNANLYLPEDS